jgi:hypothetical protein
MMVLVGKGYESLLPWTRDYPNIGRLIQPRDCGQPANTARDMTWAADNDCFNGGLDPRLWLAMLSSWAGLPGCLFATAPDVVGDAAATLEQFDHWEPVIRDHDLPVALVTQDGMTPDDVPWGRINALFIGGTDDHKLGPEARQLVRAAQHINPDLWIHMGRVNTRQRTAYACSLGCDSIDGTSVSRFTDHYLRQRATDALCQQTQLEI